MESVNSRSLDEETLSALAEVQQGIKHGRSGYRVSETAVSMLPQPESAPKTEPSTGVSLLAYMRYSKFRTNGTLVYKRASAEGYERY